MNLRIAAALLLLYAGTGVTALAYEVLWSRMLSLMFGVSIFGVVVTVGAFMAGLSLGSLFGVRRLWSAGHALKLLALLEGGIALYALSMPLLLPWLDRLVIDLSATLSLSSWQALQVLLALLVLMLPATAMGAAFPLALRAAGSVRVGLGAMYGVNAIGGAIGAVLPLLLLPWLGWGLGVRWVAAIGLLLAAVAYLISRQLPGSQDERSTVVARPHGLDLIAYAGVGAAALILEMAWTRMYGMVLLRTEYILAVLLLVYLIGIGLGSVLSRFMQSPWWLRLLPAAAALLSMLSLYTLPWVSHWAHDALFSSLASAMVWQGLAVAATTLPVTLVLGSWLPLLARDAEDEAGAGGWWYGVNCAGGAVGALLAGFVLIPWLGTAATLLLAAMLLFVCGMRWGGMPMRWLAAPLLLAVAWPVQALPPATALLPSLEGGRDLSFREDAVSLTHVVEQPGGQRLLLSDLQRMDASSEPTAVTVQKNQSRLPLLLHADPKSVLFLGLGTGITAAGSLPFGQMERRSVELSAGAIAAASTAFTQVNGGIMAQMDVVHDDARRYLRTDRNHYDVIVGDLFHPDMVGRGNLLSLQQFQRAKAHLNEGGIFVQWLALNQFDVASLQVVMHTFREAFAGGALFVDGYRIALVGVNGGHIDAAAALAHWQRLPADQQRGASGGEGLWSWLGRYWGRIPAFDAPLQDEWSPVIEYSLPKVRYSGGVDVAANWHWLLQWRAQAADAAEQLAVPEANRLDFRRAWAASEADVRLWLAELAGDERQAVYWARLSHRANELDRWPAFALADRMYESLARGAPADMGLSEALAKVLELRPDHEGALQKMMQLAVARGDGEQAAIYRQRLRRISPLASVLRVE